jgi:hypothetical protein
MNRRKPDDIVDPRWKRARTLVASVPVTATVYALTTYVLTGLLVFWPTAIGMALSIAFLSDKHLPVYRRLTLALSAIWFGFDRGIVLHETGYVSVDMIAWPVVFAALLAWAFWSVGRMALVVLGSYEIIGLLLNYESFKRAVSVTAFWSDTAVWAVMLVLLALALRERPSDETSVKSAAP